MTARAEWLAGLSVGDLVVVMRAYPGPILDRVVRVTRTQIVLEGYGRFRRADGVEFGRSSYRVGWRIEEATPETQARVQMTRMRERCSCAHDLDAATDAEVEALDAIFAAVKARRKT